ncbi:MAG: MFS transporter [Muribaculaceae bacterium]|nr:MFS transporter [Muribaculaceae bacterium]
MPKNIKFRLIVMNFLQFAIWGAYLTCVGNYLGRVGLGDLIPWFYSIQGIVSIFMPAIMGIIADKYIQPQKLLGICHLLAGTLMLCAWYIGYSAGLQGITPDRTSILLVYTLSVAFYMPTLALSNTVAFSTLRSNGFDTITDFPPIRVFGTVGFIATMWFVNCATLTTDGQFFFSLDNNMRFQYTEMQLFVSGALGMLLAAYCFTLPQCAITKDNSDKSLAQKLGLDAFKLFKSRKMAMFFIFSMLLGMSLQITNGYATPFITSFKGVAEYANTFGANNATLLTSLSQISEALCILLIPFFLHRFGIKKVMLIAMFAWVLRFGLFGLGDPGNGVWMFVLSMIVYGVAFDFFNVSGALFVERETDQSIQASAQGLFMLMTNGIGATVGTLMAGKVVDHFCKWNADGYLLGDWQSTWMIFAGYSLLITILFAFLFKYKHNQNIKK